MSLRNSIFLLLLVLSITTQAQDEWTFRDKEHHHDSTQNEIWLSADQPGFGTGSEIIPVRHLQWELGFDVTHILGTHMLGLPISLFRYAVHPRVQLDASAGFNLYNDASLFSGPKNKVFVGLGVTWLIYHPKKLLHRKK